MLSTGWANIYSRERNELVFETRNKAYGAYQLRKQEPKIILFAMILAFGLVAVIPTLVPKASVVAHQVFPDVVIPDLIQIVDLTKSKVVVNDHRQDHSNATSSDQNTSTTSDNSSTNSSTSSISSSVLWPLGSDASPDGGPIDPLGDGSDGNMRGIPSGGSEIDGELPIDQWSAELESLPSFPGGAEALSFFLNNKIDFDKLSETDRFDGKLWVTFVVLKNGDIADVRLQTKEKISEVLEKRIYQAMASMPLWTPGMMGKQPVNVRQILPLEFKIRD
jgi:protein TonB